MNFCYTLFHVINIKIMFYNWQSTLSIEISVQIRSLADTFRLSANFSATYGYMDTCKQCYIYNFNNEKSLAINERHTNRNNNLLRLAQNKR
jgi:hypothetical protein